MVGMIKKIGWLILLVNVNLFYPIGFSQNLVTNPSLESFSSCPSTIGQMNLANGWFRLSTHGGNPDYLNSCSASALVDVPANAFGTQTPATGNGYAGMALYYAGNWREYIQIQLISPMVAGETYTIQLQASLADESQFSSPAFQFYFSNSIFVCSGCGGPVTVVVPQVSSTTHVTSKTGWTTVTANYTAIGGEQFMTFGNFRDDANTPLTGAGTGLYPMVYYYMDDFSITPAIPLPVELISYDIECKNDSIKVNWTTASETNNDYFTIETSNDGINFSESGRVVVAGNSNQILDYNYAIPYNHYTEKYIRLTQTDIDGKVNLYSTKYIECSDLNEETCPIVEIKNGNLNLYAQTNKDQELLISMFSYNGTCVDQFSVNMVKGDNHIQHPVDALPSNIYFIQIIGADKYCSKKIFLLK